MPGNNDQKSIVEVIKGVERDFADLVSKKGIHFAFVRYAADDAVLLRNNRIIQGKEQIDAFLRGNDATGLNWEPEFIDVADSGDLAYSYGKYTFTQINEKGAETVSEGIFHTIWKKQQDHSWKFVWD